MAFRIACNVQQWQSRATLSQWGRPIGQAYDGLTMDEAEDVDPDADYQVSGLGKKLKKAAKKVGTAYKKAGKAVVKAAKKAAPIALELGAAYMTGGTSLAMSRGMGMLGGKQQATAEQGFDEMTAAEQQQQFQTAANHPANTGRPTMARSNSRGGGDGGIQDDDPAPAPPPVSPAMLAVGGVALFLLLRK